MARVKAMVARAKSFSRANPVTVRYMADGLLAAGAFNLASINNNLFATRLGATDYQLSLIQFLPMMLNLLVLLPGGFITDSLRNKQRMVTVMLAVVSLGYALCACAPFAMDGAIYFFLGFLSVAAAAVSLYNMSWQSFFPDVVDMERRNHVLTLRTQVTTLISILFPLVSGGVLTWISSRDGKIQTHQLFYITASVMCLFGLFNFRRIQAVRPGTPRRVSFGEVKKAARSLTRNKPFLIFTAITLFFYMTWMSDWTLYYIGQVQYLHLNELQVSLVTVGGTAMQFLTLRFWSKKNEKLGVVLPVAFGIAGLSLCPLSMVVAVSLPPWLGPNAFILFHTLANVAFITIALNMFQCQLQVIDEAYRSFSLAVFSSLTCLSNAIMPVAGVALYRSLGGDLNALRNTFWLLFALRLVAAGLWLLRWRATRALVK